MAREIALYEIPKNLESARVLDDSVLVQYNDSVKSAYNSETARAVLSKFGSQSGELAGSNPFMLVHLQNSGFVQGRIATRQDLESALKFGLPLAGNYVDFGLALRTQGDNYAQNDLLAKNLTEQLKQRAIKLGKGKFIPISALTLKEDTNSAYGLVFDLKNSDGVEDLSKQKWDYQKEQGLARAYLNRSGNWNSYDDYLGNSNGNGRVVVVSGSAEGTAKNFLDAKLTELQSQRDAQIAEISRRYTQAEKILRGK